MADMTENRPMLDRRRFTLSALALGGSAAALAACGQTSTAQTPNSQTPESLPQERKTAVMSATESNIDWANLTKGEWQNRLTEEEYYVLRREGTERPFTSYCHHCLIEFAITTN